MRECCKVEANLVRVRPAPDKWIDTCSVCGARHRGMVAGPCGSSGQVYEKYLVKWDIENRIEDIERDRRLGRRNTLPEEDAALIAELRAQAVAAERAIITFGRA